VHTLPVAQLAGPELDVRLLVDHRERLVTQRTRLSNDLRWNLHDLWPALELPARGLSAVRWQERITARLARAEQTTRVRIARDELRRVRELTRAINELERELAVLVTEVAPQLLAERGCGALIAAKLVGEIAGVQRFDSDAKLARIAGSAPVPASSGHSERHRLDRGGNRQLNCALHRLAVTKGRLDPDTAAYLARRQAEGKTRREALRCLKRHLARRVWQLLTPLQVLLIWRSSTAQTRERQLSMSSGPARRGPHDCFCMDAALAVVDRIRALLPRADWRPRRRSGRLYAATA